MYLKRDEFLIMFTAGEDEHQNSLRTKGCPGVVAIFPNKRGEFQTRFLSRYFEQIKQIVPTNQIEAVLAEYERMRGFYSAGTITAKL